MPRPCSICRHTERHDIEADLRAGIAYRDVAHRHDVSKDALSRHRAHHVSRDNATALATAAKIMALLDEAGTAATWNITLIAIREVRRHMQEMMMMLTGPVPSSSDSGGLRKRVLTA